MIDHPSPNHGPRRDGLTAEMVVLHYTAMPSAKAALARLCDPSAEVSAHYLIGRDGTVWHLVDEDRRAWHADAGGWAGAGDVNSRSVGIELDNPGTHPFPEPQMAALEPLLRTVLDRHGIAPERVIAHSDMAPARKNDPGPRFDWRRLALQGLSVWPQGDGDPSRPGDAGAFHAAATAFGYPEAATAARLRAVRLRFRPWAEGPLSDADVAAIGDLSRRFPVDRRAVSA